MTTAPTFTTRSIGGHWHLIVTEDGREERYPATSETEAKLMMRFEKRRREVPVE